MFADKSPPALTGGTPLEGTHTATSVLIKVQLDEPGTCYAKAVARGSNAPTSEAVQLAESPESSAVETAGVMVALTIGSLTEDKAYDVYVVCKDTAGNVQTELTKKEVSTPGQ